MNKNFILKGQYWTKDRTRSWILSEHFLKSFGNPYFTQALNILGAGQFKNGRHYWEVDITPDYLIESGIAKHNCIHRTRFRQASLARLIKGVGRAYFEKIQDCKEKSIWKSFKMSLRIFFHKIIGLDYESFYWKIILSQPKWLAIVNKVFKPFTYSPLHFA